MLILDTQAVLWHRLGDPQLGPLATQAIEGAWHSDQIAVSAISFWEIAMLKEKGRLRFPDDVHQWRQELLNQGIVEMPVTGLIAASAGLLTDMHGDPADRLIVATTLEGHDLVTSDRQILAWPGLLSRIDARQ